MAVGGRDDQGMTKTMARAIELTEEALAQVARIAVEGIHGGLEASKHIEAAERDMRGALRQLVLAEREVRSRSESRSDFDERSETEHVPDAMPAPGSDGVRPGA